jgi:hypothetical protein
MNMLLSPDNEGTLAGTAGEPEGARSDGTAAPGSGAAVTTDTTTETKQPTLEEVQAELTKVTGERDYARKLQPKYQTLKAKFEALAKTQPVSNIGSDLQPQPAEIDPDAPLTREEIQSLAKQGAIEAARELEEKNSQVNTESEFYDYCAKEYKLEAEDARDLLLESVRFKNSHTTQGIAALRKEGLQPMSLAEQSNFVKAAVRGLHADELVKAAENKGYKSGYDVGIGKVKGSPPHGGDAPPRQVATGSEATGVMADIAGAYNKL